MPSIWIILIAVMLASFIVQQMLQSRFTKYGRVPIRLSGAQVAQMMLRAHNISDVQVTCIEGTLTDHYNPQTKTVNLSRAVYEGIYGRRVDCHTRKTRIGYMGTNK